MAANEYLSLQHRYMRDALSYKGCELYHHEFIRGLNH